MMAKRDAQIAIRNRPARKAAFARCGIHHIRALLDPTRKTILGKGAVLDYAQSSGVAIEFGPDWVLESSL
jgi:hypothetical protein